MAGKTFEFWASLGLEDFTINRLDGGTSRTLGDRFGAFAANETVQAITLGQPRRAKSLAAIVGILFKVIQGGVDVQLYQQPTFTESVKIAELFADSADWAISKLGHSPITGRAACVTAFTVAHHWGDEQSPEPADVLEKAAMQIKSGEALRGVPLMMRKYLDALRNPHHRLHGDTSWTSFLKLLRGCRAVMTEEPIRRNLFAPARPMSFLVTFIGDLAELRRRVGFVRLAKVK